MDIATGKQNTLTEVVEGMLPIGVTLDYLDSVIKPLTDSVRPVVLPGVLNIVPVPAEGVGHMAYPFIIGITVDIKEIGKHDPFQGILRCSDDPVKELKGIIGFFKFR